jgi:hypothetical protein
MTAEIRWALGISIRADRLGFHGMVRFTVENVLLCFCCFGVGIIAQMSKIKGLSILQCLDLIALHFPIDIISKPAQVTEFQMGVKFEPGPQINRDSYFISDEDVRRGSHSSPVKWFP